MASSPDHRPSSSTSASSQTEEATYAFLNHSSFTVPNNLPPNVDNKPLARQRRRRTSPEDQLILEAAYNRDTKPDKAARLKLVKQVALGEKEVQIWFQNRRQTSRRKCRPLLPHEIASYRSIWSGPSPAPDIDNLPCPDENSDASLVMQDETPSAPAHSGQVDLGDRLSERKQDQSSELQDGQRTQLSSLDNFRPPGYLANRRSASSLRSNDEGHSDVVGTENGPRTETISKVKRSSSFVRLAMTSDGKASVTTKDLSSPSPPRPSESAPSLSSGTMYSGRLSSSLGNLDTRTSKTSVGRARDSRTWEFWCDKQARFDLQEKAEKDASGSAADAIGLLRSSSGRTILGAVSWRKNLHNSKPKSAAEHTKFHPYDVLHRSNTAVERRRDPESKEAEQKKRQTLVRPSDNDSDKENQSPREEHPSVQETSDRDNLGQRSPVPFQRSHTFHGYDGVDARTSNERAFKSVAIYNVDNESSDLETDPEVAEFMLGGRSSDGTSQEEDLDCVQGLLRLSQGNWR